MRIDPSSFREAKNYSFLLLKYRQRSEKEITDRLKGKKFPEDIILQTLKYLKEKKLVDDNYFARLWIESRIKRSFGLRTIKSQLLQKGVHKDIITQQIALIQPGYQEEEIIGELIERRKTHDGYSAQKQNKEYTYFFAEDSPPKIIDAMKEL